MMVDLMAIVKYYATPNPLLPRTDRNHPRPAVRSFVGVIVRSSGNANEIRHGILY